MVRCQIPNEGEANRSSIPAQHCRSENGGISQTYSSYVGEAQWPWVLLKCCISDNNVIAQFKKILVDEARERELVETEALWGLRKKVIMMARHQGDRASLLTRDSRNSSRRTEKTASPDQRETVENPDHLAGQRVDQDIARERQKHETEMREM